LRLLAELQIADGDLEETRAIHTRATARDFEQVGHDIKDKTHCRDADNRGFQRFFASDPRLMRIQDAAKLPECDYLAG
jgi:hypothetical protein